MDDLVFEYTISENERSNYVFIVDSASKANNYYVRFYLDRNAVLIAELFIDRVDAHVTIDCILRGQGADARITGAYDLHLSNKVEIKTLQHHQACDTRSTLIMRGILHNESYAYYHGTVWVERGADRAVASQENKNMLFGEKSRAISIPSLEVLTHDVRCSHGSAIGRWDKEQLLYCAARGIDEKAAQKLLVKAFFAGLFVDKKMNDKIMVEYE